jgi:hypothetical protein
MHQTLNQQDMLASNIRRMAEEDFHYFPFMALLAVSRLDELANHGNFECPHQVSHEHEGIFQYGQSLNGLTLVIGGDVASQFFHALLDLVRRNDLSK